MTLYDIPKSFFWQKLFVWPLISITFFIIMLIVDIVLIIRLLKKEKITKDNLIKYSFYLLAILFTVRFMCNFAQYFRFGIHMPSDQEEVITYVGHVEKIRELPSVIRFGKHDDGNIRRAYSVIIDGTCFFCLDADYFTIVNKVTIKYLPNSKVIVFCSLNGEGV